MEFFSLNRTPDFVNGEVIVFDKPLSWTSFDVVNKIRKKISQYTGIRKFKVGHAGTLDPLASGVLILCTGKKTKLIEELQGGTKVYRAEFFVGATTPSFDLETEINQTFDISQISESQIRETLESLCGTRNQTPPIYSAVQVKGKRAYEFARKGKSVELKHREITIYGIEVNKIELPIVDITITCSKGTYIRSLADEFGQKLSNGAYLKSLRRLQSGEAKIENAVSIDEFWNFLDGLMQKEANNSQENA
ncbi:MAG: tRNA pseudouridine(55) synthase TruB [Bacteroidales bacterium]|nr:tRNA pseudouridine(55) synthase TruB [Bacteroidales bacterium]